jgi:ABC-type transport system involved in cytochrome bd biosynthesis fused ATPase/permease subunit
MEREFRRLKHEAALAQLDREYEEIRQQCLMRDRGTTHVPTLSDFWGLIIGGNAFVLVFIWIAAKAKSDPRAGPFWILIILLAIWFAITFFRYAKEHYTKWQRLSVAQARWQRNRELLEQTGATLTTRPQPASPAAVT